MFKINKKAIGIVFSVILMVVILIGLINQVLGNADPQGTLHLDKKYTIGEECFRVAMSSDGSYVAAASGDNNKLYLFHNGALKWSSPLEAHVECISLSSDGGLIAVGTENYYPHDGEFYLFNRESSSPVIEYSSPTQAIAISADGKYIIAGMENIISVFQYGLSVPIWKMDLPDRVESISISQDGRYFVASVDDSTTGDMVGPGFLYVFSMETQSTLWTRAFGYYAGAAVISGNGKYIMGVGGNEMSGDDSQISQFTNQNETPLWHQFVGQAIDPGELKTSYDGTIFAFLTTAGSSPDVTTKLAVFDRNIIHEITLPLQTWMFNGLVMSEDGQNIFVISNLSTPTKHFYLYSYRYSNGTLSLAKQYGADDNGFFFDIACSKDGNSIVATAELPSGENAILFFDNSKNVQGTFDWFNIYLVIGFVTVLVAIGTLVAHLIGDRKIRNKRTFVIRAHTFRSITNRIGPIEGKANAFP